MYAPNIKKCVNSFLDCTSLTSFDLSGLGMSKATYFNGMFGRMSNITSINLSGWSTSNVTDTTNMFTECRKLKTIYVSEGWSVAKVKSDTNMFSNCTSIRGGSGKTYNQNQWGKSMANYSNGYLTYKAYTAKANIAAPSSSVIISSAKATDGLTVEEILNNDSAFTDPIRAVNEESTDAENEDADTQNADVAVQSMDDPSGKLLYSHSDLNDENETCHKDINDANQTIKVKGYRDCTVIKRIKADDYWKEHGDPTFIFKLTGTDTLGASHTYYQSVTFTESYVKAHTDSDGYVEMKAIFGQVPAGEYTCSEESVSRFEFESLTKPVNATINGKTAVYHLTDNDKACATFTNKKYEEGDFGHDSVVVNHFNHKTQD